MALDQSWTAVTPYSMPPHHRLVEFIKDGWEAPMLMRWADFPPWWNVANLYWRYFERPENVIELAAHKGR